MPALRRGCGLLVGRWGASGSGEGGSRFTSEPGPGLCKGTTPWRSDRAGPDHPRPGSPWRRPRPGAAERGARPGGAAAGRDRSTARQGQFAVYGSAQWTVPTRTWRRSCSRSAGHQQRGDQRPVVRGQPEAALQGSFGRDGAIGCYEDIDHADVFVLWDINLPRPTRCCSPACWIGSASIGVRIIDLGRERPPPATHRTMPAARAACRSGDRQRHLLRDHRAQVGPSGVRDRQVAFKRGRTNLGDGSGDAALVPDEATTRAGRSTSPPGRL